MKLPLKQKNYLFVFLLLVFIGPVYAQKTVYKPAEWSRVGTPYYGLLNDTRSYQSANFVIFWGDAVGNDPNTATPANRRFNPRGVCDTLEYIYKRFIKDLKFCSDDPATNLGKYKIIIVMLGTFGADGPQGFAFGGSYDRIIGAMWVDPAAVKDGGALSHELMHSLQNMISIQENKNPGGGFVGNDAAGFFYEGHANYSRSLVYQKMAETDMARWLATRSYQWSSTRHHYCNFHLLFYVQEADGFDMTRRMWAESQRNEHPLMTLRRLKGFTQSQFNDYLYNYAKKQATFDYPIDKDSKINPNNSFGTVLRNTVANLKNQQARYLWKQYTILDKIAGSTDRYVVSDDWAPQDYGINIIPLHSNCAGPSKVVTVKFKGHTEVNNTFAGWRYGFVTATANGQVSRYSDMYKENEAEISFNQQANETQIFLVVFGAPTQHTSYAWEPGYPKIKRYPYEIKIANAVPEGYQTGFRSNLKVNGRAHSNGGGWVSNGTTIASTVYIAPNAIVRGGNYSGNVRIEGTAFVEGARMRDNVVIRGNACIFRGTYSADTIVDDNAFLENCTVTGTALVKDNVFAFGANYSGNVVVGGDSENGDCATGVYLQFPHGNNRRSNCDGKGATDPSNIDVNPTFTLFTSQQLAFNAAPNCNDAITGMDEDYLNNSPTKLYPNPFSNSFKLQHSGKFTYTINDLLGNVIESGKAEDLLQLGEQLISGIYILQLQDSDARYVYKITRQ